MHTRASAKRQAAFLEESLGATSLSSPPATPSAGQDNKDVQAAFGINTSSNVSKAINFGAALPTPSPSANVKRKRTTKKTVTEPVSDGWDILPHGLGRKGDLADGTTIDQVVSNESGSAPSSKRVRRRSSGKDGDAMIFEAGGAGVDAEDSIDDSTFTEFIAKLAGSDKDDRQISVSEIPAHRGRGGVATAPETTVRDKDIKDEDLKEEKPKKKRAPRKRKVVDTSADLLEKADDVIDASVNGPKKERKKKHRYGLTSGSTPFPDHAMPTPEACEEVNRLLSELHGAVEQPKIIPPPSMDVTGCGEVPDLLDAILRTRLSAATTANNANMSLKGLKDTFGLRTSGVGKGSVNWEAVHKADLSAIIEAIKSGGLAKTKGTDIKKILDMVYGRNRARRDELLKEKETGEPADALGANHEMQRQNDAELAKFDETLLSMDHVFEMTNDEAMEEMTKLPGIGVKTASCVILFCMKRPSFAVDTHVYRHCKWLGWVPEKASRDQTFSHCEVRVPDHLKYSLHQLFLRHGKTCGRCRANTSAGTKEWDATVCPIEHLVTRKEARKMPGASPSKSAKSGSPVKKTKSAGGKKGVKGKKGKKIEDDDDETEESDVEIEGNETELSEFEGEGDEEA